MADNNREILLEITNLVRAADSVMPDEGPAAIQTWMNRVVNLMLWAAELLEGRPAYEIAAEIMEDQENI